MSYSVKMNPSYLMMSVKVEEGSEGGEVSWSGLSFGLLTQQLRTGNVEAFAPIQLSHVEVYTSVCNEC